jgi:hypothetical protein
MVTEDTKTPEAKTPAVDALVPDLPISGVREDLLDADVVDDVYRAKVHVVNDAMQSIGMGRYQVPLFLLPIPLLPRKTNLRFSQWGLFAVAGFGYFADSVWPLLAGLILSPAVSEFGFNAPFLSLALNAGLLVGAIVWGVGSDVVGRRFVRLLSSSSSGV